MRPKEGETIMVIWVYTLNKKGRRFCPIDGQWHSTHNGEIWMSTYASYLEYWRKAE